MAQDDETLVCIHYEFVAAENECQDQGSNMNKCEWASWSTVNF